MTYRQGMRGEGVKLIQQKVGATADGIFGSATYQKVKDWQKKNGLVNDGLVGTKTQAKMGLTEQLKQTEWSVDIKTPRYKQNDKRWAKKQYSNHNDKQQTCGLSGCGPSCIADIIAATVDKTVTPVETCDACLKNGSRTYNSGTTVTGLIKVLRGYGLEVKQTSNTGELMEHIKNENLAFVCVGSTKTSEGVRFSSGGHYIEMVGYKDGRILLNDVASTAKNRSSILPQDLNKIRKIAYVLVKMEHL